MLSNCEKTNISKDVVISKFLIVSGSAVAIATLTACAGGAPAAPAAPNGQPSPLVNRLLHPLLQNP